MKIDFKGVERFLKAPDKAARAILVFGPDDGLVRERAAGLSRTGISWARSRGPEKTLAARRLVESSALHSTFPALGHGASSTCLQLPEHA
jgi:hypothetical protein